MTNKEYGQALYEATKDLPKDKLNKAVFEFVKILTKNRKLKASDKIINEFIKYAKKQEGIMDIEVVSARKLDNDTIEEIKKIFGKQTNSIERIDEELLGGVKIKTDRMILDASLRTQLSTLKQAFNK